MAGNKKRELAHRIEQADAATAEAVKPYRQTAPVRTLSFISKLGDQPPLRTLCGFAIAGGLLAGNARLVRTGVRALASHTLATVVKDAIKHRVDRARPHSSDSGTAELKPGNDHSKEKTSFPSGHSAGAAAVASAIGRDFPEYRTAAYSAAGLIALAQVPRCSHYPSDVGAGLAIGIASDLLLAPLADRLFAAAGAGQAVETRTEETAPLQLAG